MKNKKISLRNILLPLVVIIPAVWFFFVPFILDRSYLNQAVQVADRQIASITSPTGDSSSYYVGGLQGVGTVRIGADYEKRDNKDQAVVVYKYRPQGGDHDAYITILLQIQQTKWYANNTQFTDIQPSIKVSGYPAKYFERNSGPLPGSQNQSNYQQQSTSAKSDKDVERETDIKALHGQVEAFYAQNGYYPSLANLNDAVWRSSHMRGLDNEALKDPEGTSSILAPIATKNIYSYSVSPSGCDNGTKGKCTSYILTALRENGTAYQKRALN